MNVSLLLQRLPRRILEASLITVGTVCLYVVLGKLGIYISVPPGYATLIWPPSGLALAAILLYGFLSIPGIFIGAFLLNLSVIGGISFESGIDWSKSIIPAMIAFGSTLQPILTRKKLLSKGSGCPLILNRGNISLI